ncbi:hypothetical protein JXC34_02180 [Candidatus Woesearchaeota archaeon]|nr:hypothetical protein [Candidatus Woesearchaeota archaeon]
MAKKSIIDQAKRFNLKTLAPLLLVLFLYIIKKEFFFVLIYYFVDTAKNIFKVKFRFFPIDLSFIFGVSAVYFYGPIYSLLILLIADINRLVYGFFEQRHVLSTIHEVFLFFLAVLFIRAEFLTYAAIMLFLKYISRILFNLVIPSETIFRKLHFYLINTVCSMILFYIINEISFLL